MNCKNPDCYNDTKNENLYCSLICRNIYINKYCIDYAKMRNTFSNKRKSEEQKYLLDPKKCGQCGKPIPFKNKKNKFCNRSCSNSFNNKYTNKNKDYKGFAFKISESLKEHYKNKETSKKLKICINCNNEFSVDNKYFCSTLCRKEHSRKNMSSYIIYKANSQFKFSLNEYQKEFDFELIEKYGWYSPKNSKNPNINGVSRDHMLSINDGFLNKIDPEIISHPANCKLMRHSQNISKNKKSTITLEELEEKILIFNNRYKNI